jgi:hypothetical protein
MGAIPWAPSLQNGDTRAKALMLDFDGLGHHLQPSAARSLRAFANEFEAKFGVKFTVSEAFRDLPTQDYYWDLYQNHNGNPAARRGTSTHGLGLAVDINSWVYGNGSGTERHRWLVANAPRFGWSWELVGKPSGEPWHFNYVGGWDDWPDTTPAAPTYQAAAWAKRKRLPMFFLTQNERGTGVITGPTGKERGFPNAEEWRWAQTFLYGELEDAPGGGWRPTGRTGTLTDAQRAVVKDYIKSVQPSNADIILYRKGSGTNTGEIKAVNIATGFAWHVPNPDYANLMRARGLCYDQSPINLPENEYLFVMGLVNVVPERNRDALNEKITGIPAAVNQELLDDFGKLQLDPVKRLESTTPAID